MAEGDAALRQTADEVLDQAVQELSPTDATLLLATLANRIATRLSALARTQSQATRGEAAWPAWAALQNASRNLILQTSTCRDLARRVVGSDR